MINTTTKLINCPKHPNAHSAILDIFPSKSAGIWECIEGELGECEHRKFHSEDTVIWPPSPEAEPIEGTALVCDLCGSPVLEEGNY